MKKNKTWLAVAGVVGVIVLILVAVYGSTWNSMNSKRNDVEAQWAQVENVMQRRADLIPNLVSTVKGQMNHEQKIIAAVTEARSAYAKAATPNEKLAADDAIRENTQVLVNAVTENYPELASSQSVQTLMTQLEGSENRISVERRRYIEDVNEYNKKVMSFPSSLVAGQMGFHKMDQYEATAKNADQAPTVSFD